MTAADIEVAGLQIAYERVGHGPPLVLLHGYVGDGRTTWQPQLDALSAAFTVVAWDTPGSGRSSDPPESFRLADFADCLAGFIAAIGLERPHVAGLSFGGGLALELFRRHPAVPRSLGLVAAYAGWRGSLPAAEREHRLSQVMALSEAEPDRFAREVAPTMFSPAAAGPAVDRYLASVADFHPAGLRAMAKAFAEADLRDVLPRIDVPTLVIRGDRDVRAPPGVAEALHAAIPDSRLVVLPGAGHVCNLEAPARFNTELQDFLRRSERGCAPPPFPP